MSLPTLLRPQTYYLVLAGSEFCDSFCSVRSVGRVFFGPLSSGRTIASDATTNNLGIIIRFSFLKTKLTKYTSKPKLRVTYRD